MKAVAFVVAWCNTFLNINLCSFEPITGQIIKARRKRCDGKFEMSHKHAACYVEDVKVIEHQMQAPRP